MTRFLLVRHGMNDLVGRALAGRQPGVHLNERGNQQARALAGSPPVFPIAAIFSSPLERARETAEPLATCLGLPVRVASELNELDFGDWTAKALDELEPVPAWKQWNLNRSYVRIPNGELMSEVQARMISLLEKLRREYPHSNVVLFSHGDPIKTALGHFLKAPLDFIMRFSVEPASVSVLALDEWSAVVHGINLPGWPPRLL